MIAKPMTVEATDPTTLNAIGRAFAEGVAMIACVPRRYREAWSAFAAGSTRSSLRTARRLKPGGGRSRGALRLRRGSLFFPLAGQKGAAGRLSRNLQACKNQSFLALERRCSDNIRMEYVKITGI